ncbi:hypothetical protein BGY98DRAFT_1175078 [Russula aff. rugulosa BPL654]|nr:hypothetical protein BGY98DRAFT_1175078 [Russula aff. rugulosa BPL654]
MPDNPSPTIKVDRIPPAHHGCDPGRRNRKVCIPRTGTDLNIARLVGGGDFALICIEVVMLRLFWLGEAKIQAISAFLRGDYAPLSWDFFVVLTMPGEIMAPSSQHTLSGICHEDGLTLSVLAFSTSIWLYGRELLRLKAPGLLYYINVTMYSAYFITRCDPPTRLQYWKIFVPEKYYDYPHPSST